MCVWLSFGCVRRRVGSVWVAESFTVAELVDATLMECYQKHGGEVRGPHA